MNNVKEPIHFGLTTISQEFFQLLRDGFSDRDVISILGRSFVISSVSVADDPVMPQAKASFSEVTLLAWVGVGLPPVGSVCSYQHTHHAGAWYDGEILYISDEYTIVKGDPVGEQHYYTRNLTFRQIRTPEQIAEEEREQEIQDLYFTVNWSEGRETWPFISKARKEDYAKAIDAGYRKQVAP